MSKEERIQQQVAEKLGFRVEPIVEDEGTFAQVVSMADGECYANLNDTQMFALWSALIAAETKLEPQTVAEPIDWEKEAIEALDTAFRTDHGSFGGNVVGRAAEWLKSFVQRIHSSAATEETPTLPKHIVDAIKDYFDTDWKSCDPTHFGALNSAAYIGEQVAGWWKRESLAAHSPVPDTKGLETK